MADETHDDADEPVTPGAEGEVAAADATVSVAPFIDDDEDDEPEAADQDGDAVDAGPEADEMASTTPAKSRTSKSAVGAAVATSKAKDRSSKTKIQTKVKTKTAGKDAAPADDIDDSGDDDSSDSDSPKVTRRVVTSKRVTPKGGAGQQKSTAKKAKGQPVDDAEEGFRSARYTPPGGQGAYAQGPSPWWVPVLLFGFLIIGALIIMLNYMGVFGDAQNLRLVIGLGFILAGILTSTQYR